MRAVFLCGGIGRRMFPFTEDKFLFKFLGKTLLEHQIALAQEAGIKDFVLIGNPANIERIREIVGGIPGASFEVAAQEKPLGMAHALASARHLLAGETLVVNTNDIVDRSAYRAILDGENSSFCSILGYRTKCYFPGGYLLLRGNGELDAIVEKPRRGEEPSDLVNVVLHRFADIGVFLEHLRGMEETPDDGYERTLTVMAQEGYRCRVVPYGGPWTAIKYPWDILRAMDCFLGRIKRHVAASARVSDKAVVDGEVFIDEGARVLEFAILRGPCYIGKNSVVGNFSLVRSTHLGDNSVTGIAAEFKHSYVGDSSWFHAANGVLDSVIGRGCAFASFGGIANMRWDEQTIKVRIGEQMVDTGTDKLGAMFGDRCKTGFHWVADPGVRIGAGSIIGSFVNVQEDVEPGQILRADIPVRVKDNPFRYDPENREAFLESLRRSLCAES